MQQQQRFDLVLKGGRVIDPAQGIDGVQDVAIADGKIAAVGRDLSGTGEPDLEEGLFQLRPKIEAERNPGLLALRESARKRGVAFLSDDQSVSVGLGAGRARA